MTNECHPNVFPCQDDDSALVPHSLVVVQGGRLDEKETDSMPWCSTSRINPPKKRAKTTQVLLFLPEGISFFRGQIQHKRQPIRQEIGTVGGEGG